ncbi:MAG TPA: hypothetical protein VIT88_05985 [Pyrinomonadaceae bacterium]
MNAAIVPPNEMVRPRMAVIPRLLAMASYSLPALCASLSAFLLYRVLEAMRLAENAGISAVTGGLAEANVPMLVGLYTAIAGGFITIIVAAVRSTVATTTVSPPAWFYFVTAGLCFLPVGLIWATESMFINALYPGSAGISWVADNIRTLLFLTMIVGPFVVLLVFILSVIPFRLNPNGQWLGIVILVFAQIVLILITVSFQMRTSWLWSAMESESLL